MKQKYFSPHPAAGARVMLINIPRGRNARDTADNPQEPNMMRPRNLLASVATGLIAAFMALVSTSGLMQAAVVSLPDPAVDIDRAGAKGAQTAVFAGGCF